MNVRKLKSNIKKINYNSYNRFKHYNLRIDDMTFSDSKIVTLKVFCENDLKIDDLKIDDLKIDDNKVIPCDNLKNHFNPTKDDIGNFIFLIFILVIMSALVYNAYDINNQRINGYRKK